MAIIAGVFENEVKLNEMLGQLYEVGIFESDVFLMRGASAQIAMPALPNVAMAEGELADLRITEEERKRFQAIADEGQVVCFVFAEDDTMQGVMNAMQLAEEVVDLSADDESD